MTTHLGTRLADWQGVALTPTQVTEVPDNLPRVVVTHDRKAWRWTDPAGIRRSVPDTWALPRIMGEHAIRYLGTRHTGRGFVLLLPPADA